MEKSEVLPQLDASRFNLADQERNVYRIVTDAAVTRQQMLNPAFLGHVANKLRPYDELIILKDDGTLFARAVVTQCERTWARMHITDWHDLTTKDVSLSKTEIEDHAKTAQESESLYRVEYKGPVKKWCVIRNQDGAYVREKEDAKAAANLWLQEYLKVTA